MTPMLRLAPILLLTAAAASGAGLRDAGYGDGSLTDGHGFTYFPQSDGSYIDAYGHAFAPNEEGVYRDALGNELDVPESVWLPALDGARRGAAPDADRTSPADSADADLDLPGAAPQRNRDEPSRRPARNPRDGSRSTPRALPPAVSPRVGLQDGQQEILQDDEAPPTAEQGETTGDPLLQTDGNPLVEADDPAGNRRFGPGRDGSMYMEDAGSPYLETDETAASPLFRQRQGELRGSRAELPGDEGTPDIGRLATTDALDGNPNATPQRLEPLADQPINSEEPLRPGQITLEEAQRERVHDDKYRLLDPGPAQEQSESVQHIQP